MDSTAEKLREIPTYSVSELRLVRMYMRADSKHGPTEHLMHQSQVDLFLKAALELHYQPGINPHSKLEGSPLWYVTVGYVRGNNEWWWTKVGLGIDQAVKGAEVSHWENERVWTHPELAAEE